MRQWIDLSKRLPIVGQYIWVYEEGSPEVYLDNGNTRFWDTLISIFQVVSETENNGIKEQKWRTIGGSLDIHIPCNPKDYIRPIAWMPYEYMPRPEF